MMGAAEAVAAGGGVAAGGTVAMLQRAGAVGLGAAAAAACLAVPEAALGAAVLGWVRRLLGVGFSPSKERHQFAELKKAAGACNGPQPRKFMVVTEEGWGNVRFYPFDCEDVSRRFFHDPPVLLAKVMFSSDGRELRAGGWNWLAHITIRRSHAFLYGFSPRHGLVGFVHALLRPGNVVALYCGSHKRFLRLMGEYVKGHGGLVDLADLPGDSDLFTVVDAGHGMIALHNARHDRFLHVFGDCVDAWGRVRDAQDLPADWDSERLTVVDAGHGMIALHSASHNRFLRMEEGGAVNAWGARDVDLLNAWDLERFTVRLVKLA
ncbi:hypothetical protein FOA52_007862 [Chlamydomonas sp. UWO 241]|nr:hypothetical protein FOA52_007862 [Chlamydomonas sp. UWO 241]